MALMELGSGSYEVRTADSRTSTLIGFVYVEEDTPSHYLEYFVMFSPNTLPVALPNVGDKLTFVRVDKIDGEEPESPESMASLVASAYPNETLTYQKLDVTYDEWAP